MRNYTLLLVSLIFSITIYSQGLENFDNYSSPTTAYKDATFIGQDGSTWTCFQTRGDAAAEINPSDQAIMLGKNKSSTLTSGTLHNGISSLKFSYMQAFSTNVNLEVYVNSVLVYTATTTSEPGVAKSSGTIDLSAQNITSDFVLSFKNSTTTAGQVNIDNISWTGSSTPTVCTDPTNLLINNITDHEANASWTAGGSELEWVIIYGPKDFDPVNDLGSTNVFSDTVATNSYALNSLDEYTKYDVYVKAKCDSSDFSNLVGPFGFQTAIGVSVKNQDFNHFSYYPNPIQDKLSLKSGSPIEYVIIYDLLGQVVMSSQPNTLEAQINTKEFKNGVYLIKVSLNGNQRTFKLIKR